MTCVHLLATHNIHLDQGISECETKQPQNRSCELVRAVLICHPGGKIIRFDVIRSNVLLMLIMHLSMLSYREGGGGGQAQVAYLSETEFCVQMPHCRP